jgi:hypothetical protein
VVDDKITAKILSQARKQQSELQDECEFEIKESYKLKPSHKSLEFNMSESDSDSENEDQYHNKKDTYSEEEIVIWFKFETNSTHHLIIDFLLLFFFYFYKDNRRRGSKGF